MVAQKMERLMEWCGARKDERDVVNFSGVAKRKEKLRIMSVRVYS